MDGLLRQRRAARAGADIKAIYYRNEPILIGCVPQRPPDEICRYRAIVRSALLQEHRERRRARRDLGVGARGRRRTAVRGRGDQAALSRARQQAGHVAAMCHAGAYLGRYVIVVDDDIDVTNLDDVIWALFTRSDPATSIDFIRAPGRGRSTRASSPSARPPATTPTAAP